VLSILKQHLFHDSFFFEDPVTHNVEISILWKFQYMASFKIIFLLYARKTILGTFFTHSMTFLDRTWSEKSHSMELVSERFDRHSVH
jgi:hypothetical protein